MDFNYEQSQRKLLLDHYDGIPMILVVTYKNQDYLIYVIDWDTKKGIYEYMVTHLSVEATDYVQKKGVRAFLQQQLDSQELYHLTTGMWVDSEPDKIRLITEEEAKEAFPLEEFQLDFSV